MTIAKPADGGRVERVSLEAMAGHVLEECRMVLPGIQALFGFQLIAVFNDDFAQKLTGPQQLLHLAATCLVVVAIALVMAPAALHRQVHQGQVSERFVWVASKLLLAGMFPLVLGICLEVYIVADLVTNHHGVALAVAGALLCVFAALWIWLPRRERGLESRRPRDPVMQGR